MRKTIMIPSILAAALLCVVLVWLALYPDRYDPKNISYVLWKWHLVSIDLDRAVNVMHHDRWSEKMIIGKTEPALARRFGYLLPPEAVAPCYRKASQHIAPAGDKVLFLRKSDYVIIFHDGVATRVVLLNDIGPC